MAIIFEANYFVFFCFIILQSENSILEFYFQLCLNALNLVRMQKIGSSGQKNATRCGLWWIEMLKTRDQYKEAATVYFRICTEVSSILFYKSRWVKVSFLCCWQFLFYFIFNFRSHCIQLLCLSKHPIATYCLNHACYTSMDFILFFLVIITKNVIRYL